MAKFPSINMQVAGDPWSLRQKPELEIGIDRCRQGSDWPERELISCLIEKEKQINNLIKRKSQ